MNHPALAVAEDLDLDVAGPFEVALEIDLAATKERRRLVLRDRQHPGELVAVAGDLHAAAAAAGGGLDQDRIADGRGCSLGRRRIAHTVRARHRRKPEPAHRFLCRDLVAHQPDMLGRGADEGEAVLLDRGGEVGILRQKAEPGMDRVGAGDRRRGKDRGHVQIAVARRRRTDTDRLVRQPHMHRGGVGGRMHGDRLDPHLAAGAVDPQRDLAAIGDQNLLKHDITRSASGRRRILRAGRRRPGFAPPGPRDARESGSSPSSPR